MSDSRTLEKEKKKLKEVLKEVKRELEETEEHFSTLEKNTADEFLIATLGKTYSNKIRNLEKALKNPYFARVDFREKDALASLSEIYIGKTNVFDEDSNVVVIDWRAPISSIYYDGEIGETEYECPEGIIKGELLLKRQYNIHDSELIEYNDIDVTTNDEILGKVLDENSDVRLKNIVATIQKEQNKIIRSSMFKPLIVQGVAGSGKTTVAIHRIAYLIYTYEKELKPEEILIIAPNKFFLGYIKNSLPDLGVDYIIQQTFEEFLLDTINEKVIIEDANEKLTKIIDKNNDIETNLIIESSKFKTSLRYKELIDKYLDELNNDLIKEDFKIADIVIITKQELKELLLDNYERFSLKERIERLQNFMKNKVSSLSENILDKITEKRREKLRKIDTALSIEEGQNIRKKIFEETEYEINSLLKNKGNKLVTDYIKRIKVPSILETYKKIATNIELLNKYNNSELSKYISNTTIQKLKKKILEYEDLAAIMHLHYKIIGINEKNKLKHIVIDEAQDFGEFQFFALSEVLLNNKSLTILGDIAQGIYEYRGTNNWDIINEKIFNKEANIEYLDQSYRTTENIMNEANKVLENKKDEMNITLAKSISRKGEAVNYHNINTFEEKLATIYKRIEDIKQRGYRNIAIITKDAIECNKLYEKISKQYEDTQIISENTTEYSGGITILPSYYSKGLEFDAVIIADYNSYTEEILDTKLLYVALTRAMHLLDIIY